MGIDFLIEVSHRTEARWAYSGFNHFRRKLAASIGIDLDAMVGFGGETEWGDASDEPLIHLLNHSDCDGKLDRHECEVCAPRLREAIDSVFPEDGDVLDGYDRKMGLNLAEAMERVVREEGEPGSGQYSVLRFC